MRLPARAQRGMSLVAAIFVITVMAALAAAISRMIVVNADDFAEELQVMRALHAAESGAGFGLNQLFPPQNYPVNYGTPNCPAQTQYAFAAPGLESCSATVACRLQASVADTGNSYYTITSTGTCGDVRRTLEVRSRFEP